MDLRIFLSKHLWEKIPQKEFVKWWTRLSTKELIYNFDLHHFYSYLGVYWTCTAHLWISSQQINNFHNKSVCFPHCLNLNRKFDSIDQFFKRFPHPGNDIKTESRYEIAARMEHSLTLISLTKCTGVLFEIDAKRNRDGSDRLYFFYFLTGSARLLFIAIARELTVECETNKSH